MRLLILGATGRTGKLVMEEAIAKGFEINCLVRSRRKLETSGKIRIVEGNPSNLIDLRAAMENCDYIINVLNISRKSDFPWASLRTPKTFLSRVMNNLIETSSEMNLQGITICSAWGVLETKKDLPLWFKWLIDYSNIGFAYKDHERQEKLLEKSDLKWRIVRPSGLTNTKKEQQIKESYDNSPKPSLTISRKSLAKYLIDSIYNEELKGRKVVISRM